MCFTKNRYDLKIIQNLMFTIMSSMATLFFNSLALKGGLWHPVTPL